MGVKRKLSGGTALLMSAFFLNGANAQTCTVLPTCAQLGYTMKKADCGDTSILRCPFALTDDNQVYCGQETSMSGGKISEGNVGAIVYGDGTVSATIISGKTPIGIVFDPVNRLAVALTDVKQDGSAGSEFMKWSVKLYDIPNLENCRIGDDVDSTIILSCDVDGQTNTDKILACGSDCNGTPAATACNLYQPSGCTKDFCKKGKWFLPSMRDLSNIFRVKNLINPAFSSRGGASLAGNYWSSNEADSKGIAGNFYKYENDYHEMYSDKDRASQYVRPVVKY